MTDREDGQREEALRQLRRCEANMEVVRFLENGKGAAFMIARYASWLLFSDAQEPAPCEAGSAASRDLQTE